MRNRSPRAYADESAGRHGLHCIYGPGGDAIPEQDPNRAYQTGSDKMTRGKGLLVPYDYLSHGGDEKMHC